MEENSSHGNSNHRDCSSDHCHQDSGFHENTTANVLNGDCDGDDDDDDWSCEKSCDSSMHDKLSAVCDLQVTS